MEVITNKILIGRARVMIACDRCAARLYNRRLLDLLLDAKLSGWRVYNNDVLCPACLGVIEAIADGAKYIVTCDRCGKEAETKSTYRETENYRTLPEMKSEEYTREQVDLNTLTQILQKELWRYDPVDNIVLCCDCVKQKDDHSEADC